MKYQVGDLVKYNKKVYRISCVNEKYRLPYVIENEFENHFARGNNLIPIELTTKLLKLNGFKFVEESINYSYWSQECFSRLVLSNAFKITYDGLISCCYVHELQQMARLIGSEEFADNFKTK